MEMKTTGKVVQVAFDVDEELWTNAKIQALKNHMLLKDWLAYIIKKSIDNGNNNNHS